MAKFDRTEPVSGSSLVSKPVRQNFQGIEESLLGASAKAQPSPDLTVKVEAFVYRPSHGRTRASFAGGNSPALVAPSTNPRIALLTIDDAASLAWTYGTEAASPTAPDPPANKIPICEVFQRTGMTQTKDEDDGTQGYIQRQGYQLRATSPHYAARVAHSVAQSITTGTNTILAFDSELHDNGALHAASPNSRLTAPVAGIWHVFVQLEWAGNATGQRILEVLRNGTAIVGRVRAGASVSTVVSQALAFDVALAANDYVEARVFQDSGGALNVNAAADYSPEFGMHLVGPNG